jgi:ribonuclease VapC
MIVDTSALIAILDQEPEAERIARTLAITSERMLSAANLVELGVVMQARRGDDGARDVDLLLGKLRVEIVPFTARQAEIARKAFRRYGRGQHDAKLNFGDYFAYALAKDASAPLLFKGDDFGRTGGAILKIGVFAIAHIARAVGFVPHSFLKSLTA